VTLVDTCSNLTLVALLADNRFLNIWLVSASSAVKAGIDSTYVQGGGDDHESWSLGLTPALFWRHQDEILEYSDDVEEKIRTVVRESNDIPSSRLSEVTWLGSLGIGFTGTIPLDNRYIDLIVDCCPRTSPPTEEIILAAPVTVR
jgi:hypothetical protein